MAVFELVESKDQTVVRYNFFVNYVSLLIAELLRAKGAQAEPYTLENLATHRS